MTPVRVFVNERPVEVDPGGSLRAAVTALDPELARALDEGRAYATDGVGRPVSVSDPLVAGAIIRVIRSAPRPP